LPQIPYGSLRDLYARAAVVAVPVRAVDFQAGITSLLEAMAMARPVVATANPGLREVFQDRECGIWVAPGDARAMSAALSYLLKHPREAAEMGRRGRALVEREMTLDRWVARIMAALQHTASAAA
jgi:glycosyltransferase involved in cell wall biosynthesis